MLFVLPTASAINPASYLSPQQYGHYPSRSQHLYGDMHRSILPSYPSNLGLLRQLSAEELEEREYRRALDVVINHRRRQAEKQAMIRRQQQVAEAARRQYYAALAAEIEQRQQEELLAARRAELIRLRRVLAYLLAAERQHALNAFSRQSEGPQPVCLVRIYVTPSILTKLLTQITRQPHVAKHKPVDDVLKQRLAAEPDADIAELIKNILSSLELHSAQSDKPEPPSKDASETVETQPDISHKGKGKAPGVDIEELRKPAAKPESVDGAFADILKHVVELSQSTPARRSPDEAGPSGSSSFSSFTERPVTEKEQAQIDRAVALSSIEHVQNTLSKLQTDFVLPAELDHYVPPTDDRDETASVSSVSSSDLTKLIPYTRANKPVYKFENELNGLLEELDRIDSHGDVEVREKRKQVVQAVKKALEGVEHVVGEAIEKRASLVSITTPTNDGPLKGFDVDEDVTAVAQVQEQIETVVADGVAISEQSAPASVEGAVIVPAVVPIPADESPFETDIPTAVEQTAPESDVEASTATITPDSLELKSAAETESTDHQAPETVDTFLLPEKVSPPSPAQKSRQIDSEADDGVLVLDSDTEKSDWFELE